MHHHIHHHGSGGGLIFLAIFMLVAGAAFLFWSLSARRKADASEAAARTWPAVPGVVMSAYVGQGQVDNLLALGGQINNTNQHSYQPVVIYRYTVGTQEYEGNRLRFGWFTCGTHAEANRFLAAYPVGRQLAVRFDPADPSNSVLEVAAANSNAMVGIICGAVAILFGAAMLVISMA